MNSQEPADEQTDLWRLAGWILDGLYLSRAGGAALMAFFIALATSGFCGFAVFLYGSGEIIDAAFATGLAVMLFISYVHTECDDRFGKIKR